MYHKDQWASYEDVRSIQDKTQYIKSNGLGGAMVWTMGESGGLAVYTTKAFSIDLYDISHASGLI